jgi:hypothetical protein
MTLLKNPSSERASIYRKLETEEWPNSTFALGGKKLKIGEGKEGLVFP